MLTHVLVDQKEKATRERGLSNKATPSKDKKGDDTEEEDQYEDVGRQRKRRSKISECPVTKRLVTCMYMLRTCAKVLA